MTKAILLCIKPDYCYLISKGEKTIEVRKSEPKIKPPFKCYVYCAANDRNLGLLTDGKTADLVVCDNWKTAIPVGGEIGNGKVIGEFICDKIYHYIRDSHQGKWAESLTDISDGEMIEQSCLSREQLHDYENSSNNHRWGLLGWHISDFKLYDKPKDLKEFHKPCDYAETLYCPECSWYDISSNECNNPDVEVHTPPGWCYVREQVV